MLPIARPFVLLMVLPLAACQPAGDRQAHANKELVVRFNQAVNAADWAALEPILAEDFTRHSAATAGPPVTSRRAFIELQKGFLETFGEARVEIDYMIAERDRVAVLATYTGTQVGPMGSFPATGKEVSAPFLAQFRIEADRIAEMWVEWDNLAMLAQLGHFPPQATDVAAEPPGPDSLDAIIAADQAYADAWLVGDEERIMASLTDDAVLLPSGLPALSGAQAIRAFWFPEDAPPTRVREFVLTRHDVGGGAGKGYVRGSFTLAFDYAGESYSNRGDYLTILERRPDGKWRIDQRAWNDLE